MESSEVFAVPTGLSVRSHGKCLRAATLRVRGSPSFINLKSQTHGNRRNQKADEPRVPR